MHFSMSDCTVFAEKMKHGNTINRSLIKCTKFSTQWFRQKILSFYFNILVTLLRKQYI